MSGTVNIVCGNQPCKNVDNGHLKKISSLRPSDMKSHDAIVFLHLPLIAEANTNLYSTLNTEKQYILVH